ncbi:hypothetical protein RHGRI_008457 [Rhododendron griersonianum]|uniref:Cytochrome P450 n=1 Tax=Rhododendron griersonianum TaxID=479676 RepID=A0AAV6L232_9ERIC|nr:hypothetical protein RHGRI_008457 [Rhododendron griersonianum]
MSPPLLSLIPAESNVFFPLIFLSLLFILLLTHHRTPTRKQPPLPPGPTPWPVVGNLFQLSRKTPLHISLANLAQVHGPLMLLKMGSHRLIVGSSSAAAREILNTHDRILSGRYMPHVIQTKGSKIHNHQLVFNDECDHRWRRVKSAYKSELFSARALESQVGIRERKIWELVRHLGLMDGRVVKIKEVVTFTAINIISRAMVSRDFVDLEGRGEGEGLMQNVRRFAEVGVKLGDLFAELSGWDWQGTYKEFLGVFGWCCGVWVSMVEERRGSGNGNGNGRDFADALIESGFSDDQINAMFMELFGAGIESTSATTEWALTELMRNPESMQKLRQELSKEITGDTIRESDLPRLPYLEACLKETLRLHPPGPLLLPHRAVETCEVMGCTIPKDSQILVNMWAIARDPKIWDDPLSFKPERFLSSRLDYMGTDFEYFPFGSGRRFCPGQPLASRVVPVIIASLIHNFDWVLPGNMDPAQIDMTDKLDITMLKQEPLCAIPKLRRQLMK